MLESLEATIRLYKKGMAMPSGSQRERALTWAWLGIFYLFLSMPFCAALIYWGLVESLTSRILAATMSALMAMSMLAVLWHNGKYMCFENESLDPE